MPLKKAASSESLGLSFYFENGLPCSSVGRDMGRGFESRHGNN